MPTKTKRRVSAKEQAAINATLALIQQTDLFDAIPILYKNKGAKVSVPSLPTAMNAMAMGESIVIPCKHRSYRKSKTRKYRNALANIHYAMRVAKASHYDLSRYICRSVADGFRVWRVA